MRRVGIIGAWVLSALLASSAQGEGDALLLPGASTPEAGATLPAPLAEALELDGARDSLDAWEISLGGSSSLDDPLPLALGESTSIVDAERIVPESAAQPPASASEALP